MATEIHPTAVIDRRAELGSGVKVGPFAVIEGAVTLGDGTTVGPHSILRGHTIVGANCRIGPAAYVGLDPQHVRFDPNGPATFLTIGDGTIIREGASVHRSFKPGIENATRVGARCFLMGQSHVAHDCVLADGVTLANGVLLGGHVVVGSAAFLGGGCAVHQFCKIGRLAIVSGNEVVTREVPPFAAVRYGGLKGYNAVGCKRAGIARQSIHDLRAAFRCLHSHRTTTAAVEAIRALNSQSPEVKELLDFIAAAKRGIQPSVRFNAMTRGGGDADDE